MTVDYGTVNDGSYSGGTAGYTSGNIDNCIAINDVDGNDHIGGIAGSAKNINTSYSLPRLDGKKDDAGAIVGFVDGDVTGCYFIDEGLSGISGMNLEGRAEAVKPDDMYCFIRKYRRFTDCDLWGTAFC